MPIVGAAILPHGFPVIPHLSEDAEGALKTRNAMEKAGEALRKLHPEVVIIATPHGFRVQDHIALSYAARGAGTLFWQGKSLEMNIPLEGPFAARLAEAGKAKGLPLALVGFAGNRWDQSSLPLDWGVITPAWFLGHNRHLPGRGHVLAPVPEGPEGPPVLVVTPSRTLPWETLIDFGRLLAREAAADPRPMVFVASCDWAHTHREDGPYGYHPKGPEVDRKVAKAVAEHRLEDLLDLSPRDLEEAAVDGFWQVLMLMGILREVPMEGELLSYEAPSYYGMMVARYWPKT